MPFKGLSKEELRHSKELRAHGLRVMGFVQKVVARLDEPEKSENLLKELGRNHVMYGAKVHYVDVSRMMYTWHLANLTKYLSLHSLYNISKSNNSNAKCSQNVFNFRLYVLDFF